MNPTEILISIRDRLQPEGVRIVKFMIEPDTPEGQCLLMVIDDGLAAQILVEPDDWKQPEKLIEFAVNWYYSERDRLRDEQAEKQHISHLESIGAIRDDGTLDPTKFKFFLAQTIDELMDLVKDRSDEGDDA